MAVNSLAPEQGALLISSSPPTYLICAVKPSSSITNLIARAIPCPQVEDANLPSDWTMSGGTVVTRSKVSVDLTTIGLNTVKADCGVSHKVNLIYVARIQAKATSLGHLNMSLNSSQYSNDPQKGCADNLLSLWPEDDIRIRVKVEPAGLESKLPSGFIKWSSSGYNISDNTIEQTFHWGTPGVRTISISMPSLGSGTTIIIDQPDVGDTSETAAALLDFGRIPLILGYANEAEDWAAAQGATLGAGKANALQHAYWNALMASDSGIGPELAIYHSTAHEYSNKNDPEAAGLASDSTMDLHNNSVGAGVIHQTYVASPDPKLVPDRTAIQTDLLQKLESGVLWTLTLDNMAQKSNDEKIYPGANCCGDE